MAALTQDRTKIHTIGTTFTTRNGIAGAIIAPGQPVYLNSADNKFYKADNASSAAAAAVGIALTASQADEPVILQTGGDIDLSATTTYGKSYYVGAAGGIIPEADLGTGDFVTFLGISLQTTGPMQMGIIVSGVQIGGPA
jgi:hypothetical protein